MDDQFVYKCLFAFKFPDPITLCNHHPKPEVKKGYYPSCEAYKCKICGKIYLETLHYSPISNTPVFLHQNDAEPFTVKDGDAILLVGKTMYDSNYSSIKEKIYNDFTEYNNHYLFP